MQARVRLLTTSLALASGTLAFLSGLVLLLAFHVGVGCFRPELLGITRLVWQNLHRFSACAVLVSVAVHIGINLTSMRARFTRLHRGSVGRRDASALLLYTAFITVVVTGFVVWLVLANSMPVLGPALLGPIPGMRHRWIDVHNLAGLLSLYFTVSHLRRNWPALIATVHRVHSQRTAPRPVSSTTKHTPTGGERLP